MEKHQQYQYQPTYQRPQFKSSSRPSSIKLALAATLSLFGIYGLVSQLYSKYRSSQILEHPASTARFDWSTASIHSSLSYTECYDGDFQCARLSLPMDYWNGTTNASIALAVIRKPAAVPVTDPRYGGAILLNPGGPGGSGIAFMLGGRGISVIVDAKEDSENAKYFDLISFDPRGVTYTSPQIRCSPDELWSQSWELRTTTEGILGSSDASFGRLWSMAKAKSASCSLPREDGEPDIKQYMTTAYVARDMLELIEKHGEWRQMEAKRLLGLSAKAAVPAAVAYKPGEEKIQYWGFSYGTYLGMTFAAMFPDRVGRLVVDGVVDAVDYTKALWYDNLVDTEKDVDLLYYHCARVGYPTCALANKKGKTTPEDVKQRIEHITMSLYHNPLPVISPTRPEVIEYSDIKNLIFAAVYNPIQSFPFVTNLLSDLEQGNGTRFAELTEGYHAFTCPTCSGKASTLPLRNQTGVHEIPAFGVDNTRAIACTDGDDQTSVTRSEFAEFVKNITALSPSIGSMWATIRLQCIHYTLRPIHRYPGPWKANTSHPLLFLGNSADPVTPLRNAIKHAKGFEGAVALEQKSPGHCTLAAHSRCTEGFVRGYFQNGEMPPPGTRCEVDEVPFGEGGDEVEVVSSEIREGRERSRTLAEALNVAGGGWRKALGVKVASRGF